MSNNVHYNYCPVCGSASIHDVFKVKDYTVSGESFMIAGCESCSLRFTQDVPGANSIGPYYRSEDYISHTNTSKGIINGLYQFVRKRTMTAKRKLVEKETGARKGRLLDVGSGIGSFVHHMREYGWDATGLEPDEGARKVANDQYNLELGSMEVFNTLPAGSFDAITLWHVLEHVHDLHPYMQRLKALLKEGGRLFIAVPNYTSKDAGIYREHWAAYDVPRHLYHFSPQSMKVLTEKNGLVIKAYKPMWYDSFYISMLSNKYKAGKTGVVTAFLNGLMSNIKAMTDPKLCSSIIYIVAK